MCLLSFSCALVFSERFLREGGVLDKTREAKKASERERERERARRRARTARKTDKRRKTEKDGERQRVEF